MIARAGLSDNPTKHCVDTPLTHEEGPAWVDGCSGDAVTRWCGRTTSGSAYEINPYMDLHDQPDPVRAAAQWAALVAALESAGARVDVLEQRPDAPDMVYAMNLGFAFADARGRRRMVLSHMRHQQRRMEQSSAGPWFAERGFDPVARRARGRRARTSRPATRSAGATQWSWATGRAPTRSASRRSRTSSAYGSAACASRTRRCTTSTWRSARWTRPARWCARRRSSRPARGCCSTSSPSRWC